MSALRLMKGRWSPPTTSTVAPRRLKMCFRWGEGEIVGQFYSLAINPNYLQFLLPFSCTLTASKPLVNVASLLLQCTRLDMWKGILRVTAGCAKCSHDFPARVKLRRLGPSPPNGGFTAICKIITSSVQGSLVRRVMSPLKKHCLNTSTQSFNLFIHPSLPKQTWVR